MKLFGRKNTTPSPTSPSAVPTPTVDWSVIDNIRGEWPREALDPVVDLRNVRQALALYERDDYGTMMQCATMFATALAHSLYGPGILTGDDLPETVHKALYSALCPPPDGRTFADSAQRAARLAMTVMRENGLQPPSLGGSTPVFEAVMADPGNYMLLSSALAPAGLPWEGDLEAFFSVAPQPTIGVLPDADAERGRSMVDRLYDTVQQSEAGDTAASLHVRGMALTGQGDLEGALATFTQAAHLGSTEAMASAGDLSAQLGREEDANFWYQSAATAGHPVGMFNTAVVAAQRGDPATAQRWFRSAAEAGHVDGYAALTQMADEAGDEAAEAHWAQAGAEAGHLFCMGRYGLLLARGANGDVATTRRARDVLEQAADRGQVDSASLAVSLNHQLGDGARAQRYVRLVVESGDVEAVDRLRRHGFL